MAAPRWRPLLTFTTSSALGIFGEARKKASTTPRGFFRSGTLNMSAMQRKTKESGSSEKESRPKGVSILVRMGWGIVTTGVGERDSMAQERVPIDDLLGYLLSKVV